MIEVITGTMYGGKSTELLRRVERALFANQRVLVISKDTRFGEGVLKTHSDKSVSCHYAEDVLTVETLARMYPSDVIAIDEIQFFSPELVEVVEGLALEGHRVICAGLDQDYKGEPFETTIRLMAQAERVDKMLAICMRCGKDAVKNYRKPGHKNRVVQGDKDLYEALCRSCYNS